jgi:hypothetical protein
MTKALEQQKDDFAKILEEKYTEKDVKWSWNNKNGTVISTKVIALNSELHSYQEEQIIVENEFKFHQIELGVYVIVVIVSFILCFIKPVPLAFLFLVLCLLVFYFRYKTATKKRILILITNHGIQLENEPFIAWDNLITSYVEKRITYEDESSSSNYATYYLLLYHHNPTKDDFMVTRYQFENKGLGYKDICFYIEYWKTKNAITK